VTYLLGAPGAAVLVSDGFHVSKPAKISGTGVPAAVQGALSS
jgi:hypothetical protein